MKIIGFSQIAGDVKMVLKGDSSLLVNSKPFFIPDWSEDVRVTPCVVVRVSRLGKNIAARFATRYYDAMAYGMDLQAAEYVVKGDWVRGWAFDYSLVVGKFVQPEMLSDEKTIISVDEAIHRVSQVMTIRQGDMIYIDYPVEARQLVPEEVLCVKKDDNELLYCNIK